jgi:hypothetical protein
MAGRGFLETVSQDACICVGMMQVINKHNAVFCHIGDQAWYSHGQLTSVNHIETNVPQPRKSKWLGRLKGSLKNVPIG